MFFVFKKIRTRWFHNGRQVKASEAARLAASGEPVEKRQEESRCWYVRLRLPDGKIRDFRGYTDKAATIALATRLKRELEHEAAGLKPAERYFASPIEEPLAEFERELQGRGRTRKHIRHTLYWIRRIVEKAGIKTLGQIRPQIVREAICVLADSAETRNHYLTAIKSFTRWLWKVGRLPEDPLAGLSRWNPEPDRRVIRRPLTVEELTRLISTTENSSRVFRGLTGRDRASLYVLAAYSGLRVSELAGLTVKELALEADPPTVTVLAAYAKNRRQDTIPLPREVANYLRQWLDSRPTKPLPGVRLWPGTWIEKAAAMVRRDLQAAGIPAQNESGRVDFHSLRLTFATLLARVGVNLQTAQSLLRHSTPELTSRVYTKLGITDLGAVVSRLPTTVSGEQAAEKRGK